MGAPGACAPGFFGPWGGPGGAVRIQKEVPGGPFSGPRLRKKYEKTLEICDFLRNGVFRGGPPRTRKTASRTRAFANSRVGSKVRRRATRAPPRPFRGAPEARGTLSFSVLEATRLKMYGFPKELQGFSKITKKLRFSKRERFSRNFEAPGGPGRAQGPPGGLATFSGGGPVPYCGKIPLLRGGSGGSWEALWRSRGCVSLF